MTKKKLNLPKAQFHPTDKTGVLYLESAARTPDGKIERVYYIRYRTPDHRQHFEKVGRQFDKNKMTPAKASDIRADRSRGKELTNKAAREAKEAAKDAEAGKWTLSRLFDEYREQHPGKKLANEKSRFNNYIAPAFGDKMPEEIDPLSVDRLRMNLLKKLKPATVFAVLELFRRLVNFGVDRRLCAGLTFKMEMPKVDNLKTEDLNAEQMDRLLAVLRGERMEDDPPDADTTVDPDARDIVYMALFTGMRRGEIFALEWEGVDFRRGFLTIRNPKGGKDATIPLSDATRELLKGRPRLKGSEYVFPGRYGGKRADVKKALQKIRKRAKLPPGFRPLHGLRHVFASMLASSGEVDLHVLQRLLTHKSPTMTQRYAHLRDETLKKAANVAGRIIAATEQDAKKTDETKTEGRTS